MEMEKAVQQSVMMSTRIVDLLLQLMERLITWLLTSGVRILIIMLLAWITIRVLRGLTARLHKTMVGKSVSLERLKRADTILGMLRTVGAIFVGLAATMMALRETGIDIAPVIATAGVGGLAIGFGAQTLVKDVISGFFLLVEEQVRIGDIVEVAGKSGVVERISLRTVRLRDVGGNVHVVPNGNVTLVTNMTLDYSRYLVEAQVARREDPDRVFAALRGIGEEMQKDAELGEDILQPIEVLGVDALAAASMTIKARLTTRPMRQFRVGREFNRRMKKRFDELGIAAA
jgi:moderate conductance mechanosensitive channel